MAARMIPSTPPNARGGGKKAERTLFLELKEQLTDDHVVLHSVDYLGGRGADEGEVARVRARGLAGVRGGRPMRWSLLLAVLWTAPAGCLSDQYPESWDGDGDGYGGDADCDDTDPFVNPGARETCDGLDNDCDGEVDEIWACSPGDCGEGTRVTLVDAQVLDTADSPAGQGAMGIGVAAGASLEASQTVVEGNAGVGVAAASISTVVTLDDVVARDTVPLDDGSAGYGLAAQTSAVLLDGSSAMLEGNTYTGDAVDLVWQGCDGVDEPSGLDEAENTEICPATAYALPQFESEL